MKPILFALALLTALPALAQPQTSVTYSPEYFATTQCQYQRDPTTHAITKAPWQAFYYQAGSDGTTRPTPGLPELDIDLIAHQADTVTVGGTTYPISLALQIIATYLAQQRAAQWAALQPPSP